MRSAGFVIVAFLIAPARLALGSQSGPALSLTIEEAQERARRTSHRLAEAREREAAAQSVVAARLAAERPLASAVLGYTRTNNVPEFIVPSPEGRPRVLYPNVPDNYRTRLDLQWPVYTGGRADALERAARAEAAAVGADTATTQADLRFDVTRAFWSLVNARLAIDVFEQGLVRATTHVADVRARFEAGLVPPNEIASAQAQESRARLRLIEAQNDRDRAEAALARFIGAPQGQSITPVASLDDANPTTRATASDAGPPAQRSERQALELRIQAAEEQRQAAASAQRPVIAITGGVDYARPNARIFPREARWQESWDAGIQVSWSLWDGGRMAADVAQATNLAAAARSRLAELDSLMALEVRQRSLDADSSRAAVIAATDGVGAATEARRVVEERYRAGVIGQSDVLDAELALLQAQLDRARALVGVRLAEAGLARAQGR